MRTMNIYILIIYCLLALGTTHAQNKKIDSLNRLINTAATDTARINLIVKKIDLLSYINLDSGINLSKQTLVTAQKINYYRGEVDLRQKLASNYCFKGAYGPAAEHLNFLAHFIKPTKDSSDFAQLYGNMGMMYGMQSRYDSSIYLFDKAIGILERSGNKSDLPSYYSNIAIAFQQQSNFPRALSYQQKALHLAELNKDEVNQSYTLMNIGNTYEGLRDSARAEAHFLKAIALAKKKSLKNVELYGYSNLASLYTKQNKWKLVLEFATKAADLGGSMGDQGIQAASMSKAATALAYINKPAEAEALAKRAIVIADSSAQPLNIYQAYSTMGSILKIKGSYAAAIPFYEKGFLSLKGSDILSEDNGSIYNELSECYEKTGNYIKALQNYKIGTQITDSTRSKDNIQKATELTMNYEFEKKEQVQQAEQKAKDEVSVARQLALIIGMALTFVLAVTAFIGFKNKQRANALLKHQKKEIEQTLTLLKSTQAQLVQSEKMASLGELTAGIAHEIQNPLNFVNNFSDINKDLLLELKEEFVKGNVNEVTAIADNVISNEEKINHHGKRADAIVKGMLQHSRSSSGQKESTDINALCDEYLRLSYHGLRAKDKAFNAIIKTDFDERINKINIISQDIGRVLLNLINNAFYATAEKKKKSGNENYEPTVTLSTRQTRSLSGGQGVEIRVTDNGAGVSPAIVDKIFQPFFTTKPTGQGTGLGLSLSYDIVKAHGGEIKVESKEGEGTSFIIQLPIV